jgi:hypothetical protein
MPPGKIGLTEIAERETGGNDFWKGQTGLIFHASKTISDYWCKPKATF